MNYVIGALCAMLYLAIGVFLDTLLSNTKPSMIMVILWPVALALVVLMYICLCLPYRLAEWIKKNRKK